MERESGYYWVLIDGKWKISSWSKTEGEWYMPSNFLGLHDKDFDEIDPERIKRKSI